MKMRFCQNSIQRETCPIYNSTLMLYLVKCEFNIHVFVFESCIFAFGIYLQKRRAHLLLQKQWSLQN